MISPMNLPTLFKSTKVLVVGDIMLDRYWWGNVSRISPEAPVPVVSHENTTLVAGGAANVAANIAGLGANARLIGITGKDVDATLMPDVLSNTGVSEFDLIPIDGRKTTVKTRIIAHNQQIARLDSESTHDLSDTEAAFVFEKIKERIAEADIVVISDYGKGFLTRELLSRTISACNDLSKKILIDPKGKDYSKYAGATLLTPNKRETAEACGLEVNDPKLLDQARSQILEGLKLDALLVTRGEEGMTVLQKEGHSDDLEATARVVYDVTGAGDTAIATMAVALGSGIDLLESAKIANRAAGIVVEKVGTTPITSNDLLAFDHDRNP